MKTNNITGFHRHAFQWAEIHSEFNHLVQLSEEGKLNGEQQDYVDGYINIVAERIEDFEENLFDYDENGHYHSSVLHASELLTVEPSPDFLSHLKSQLDTMSLDGIDFDIKKAVEKYNRFYFSCAIFFYNGRVGFEGCGMDSTDTRTVLFNKSNRKNVTVADVKRKIEELKLA